VLRAKVACNDLLLIIELHYRQRTSEAPRPQADKSRVGGDPVVAARLEELNPELQSKYLTAWAILQENYLNYSGAVAEIRGVLILVLDELAPIADVMAQPGYEPDKDEHGNYRERPTQAQRVKFIARNKAHARSADILKEVALFETSLRQLGQVARMGYSQASGREKTSTDWEQAWCCLKQLDSVLAQLL
jgi:hypothetical protein